MSYNSDGYTGVLPSASGQPSGTAPTSLSAQQDSTVNNLTGSLESGLSNNTGDVTNPVVVLELEIRHEELFFEMAEQDQERGAAIEVCDLCHVIAAEWAYPTQGYPSRPKYNFDASLSEYNKKYRTNLPDATTFNEFPDLKLEEGTWRCPHSLICAAVLTKDKSAYDSGFDELEAKVYCLWCIDPKYPSGEHLVCFDADLETFKTQALKVDILTQAQRDNIAALTD